MADDPSIAERARECSVLLDGLVQALRSTSLDALDCAIDEVGVLIADLDADGLALHPTTDLLRSFVSLLWAEADRHEAEIDLELRRMLGPD